MRHAGHRAFTLVEMLVVLGIIALVMSMSIPMFVPMMRAGKLDSAKDVVKSSCLLARSKAIQERRSFAVTLFQAEQAVIITDYENLRAAANFPAQQPFAPNFLENYGGASDDVKANTRWTIVKAMATDRIRYIPEGCRFDLGVYNPPVVWNAWTYIFLPNGSAWTLPANAENKRNTWSITTYMDNGTLSGPRIFGPEDRDWADIVVYSTTGQATSK